MHFYVRHRIRLFFPRLRCLAEHGPKGSTKYYPLELLEIVDETEPEVKHESTSTDVISDTARGWYDCFYV